MATIAYTTMANRSETSRTDTSDTACDGKMPRNGSMMRSTLRYTHRVNSASVLAPNNRRKNPRVSSTRLISTMAYTRTTTAFAARRSQSCGS